MVLLEQIVYSGPFIETRPSPLDDSSSFAEHPSPVVSLTGGKHIFFETAQTPYPELKILEFWGSGPTFMSKNRVLGSALAISRFQRQDLNLVTRFNTLSPDPTILGWSGSEPRAKFRKVD